VVEVAAAAMGEAVAGAVGPAAMAAKRETQQEVAADTAAVAQVVSPVRAAAVMGVSDTFHPAERSPYRSDRRHLAASSSTERGRRSWVAPTDASSRTPPGSRGRPLSRASCS